MVLSFSFSTSMSLKKLINLDSSKPSGKISLRLSKMLKETIHLKLHDNCSGHCIWSGWRMQDMLHKEKAISRSTQDYAMMEKMLAS